MKILKKLSILICGCLVAVCVLSTFTCNKEGVSTPTRDVELKEQNVDYNNYLKSFRNSDFQVNGSISKFTGEKQLKDFDLSFLDLVSKKAIEDEMNEYVGFEFTYNRDLSKIIVTATINEGEEVLIENLIGYVFQNQNGEIDAIMTLDDGSTILLSDLASKYIDNCGWLSNLIKGVVSVVVGIVLAIVLPITIPAVIVATAVTFGAISYAEKCKADSNYAHNRKLQEPTGYVNGQGYYSDWRFGIEDLNKNGCGVIATYNVLFGLNKKKKLVDVIYEFDKNSGTLVSGIFGSDPTHYSTYFKSKHINYSKYSSYSSLQEGIKNMKSSQMILVCAWNGNSVFDGAHYVAASYDPKSANPITVYNRYSYSKSAQTFETFDESIIGGDLITAFIVG